MAHEHDRTFVSNPFIAVIALWVASSLCYYMLLPLFGVSLSYNTGPIALASYYFLWSILAIYVLGPVFEGWHPMQHKFRLYGVLGLFFLIVVIFLTRVVSILPAIDGAVAHGQITDLLFATPWYFLPKSVEILFQQILIAAFLLALARHIANMYVLSVIYMLCFGVAHLFLGLGGASLEYVRVMTLSAVASGVAFPYLIVRVKNGFIYAYMLHWLFYAVITIATHLWPPLL